MSKNRPSRLYSLICNQSLFIRKMVTDSDKILSCGDPVCWSCACVWLRMTNLSFVCDSSYYKKQFSTTNGNTFGKPVAGVTSNPGIQSEITKRNHHNRDLWGVGPPWLTWRRSPRKCAHTTHLHQVDQMERECVCARWTTYLWRRNKIETLMNTNDLHIDNHAFNMKVPCI